MSDYENLRAAVCAIAATLIVAPRDVGLTAPELKGALGLQQGEFDRLLSMICKENGFNRVGKRFTLAPHGAIQLFLMWAEDDLRELSAREALHQALDEHWRAFGENFSIDLGPARQRFRAEGGNTKDFDIVVAVAEAFGMTRDPDDKELHVMTPAWINWLGQGTPQRGVSRSDVRRQLVAVERVVATRGGVTHQIGEPLERFGVLLDALGKQHLAVWWSQIVSEARQVPDSQPVNQTVMYAAIAEGILSFVYVTVRSSGLSMAKKGPDVDDARKWRFRDLVLAAATGNPPLVDHVLRQQLLDLNDDRQRIHAGRMLFQAKGNPLPKLEVNKGRDARRVTERLAATVVDWLEANSPTLAQ